MIKSNIIKELRTKKNVTQEEMAKTLKISTQAISKWENGGAPDIDMIPLIADYFGVSIDYLFGHQRVYDQDIEKVLAYYLNTITDEKEKFNKVYKLSFIMSVLCQDPGVNIDRNDIDNMIKGNSTFYSSIVNNGGVSITSFNGNLPFNFCFPYPQNGTYDYCYKNKDRHLQFLKAISQDDFYNALICLYKKDETRFTLTLLEKKLKINAERAKEIISNLLDFNIVSKEELVLDEQTISTYKLNKTPFIIAFLAGLELMTKKSYNYYYYLIDHNVNFFDKVDNN